MKLRNTWAFVCAMVLIIAGNIQAANLTWDANNTGALQTDGVGTWLNANQWWNGSTNVTWNNTTPDNATIGNGGAGNTITLGTVNAGTVTFGSFTGTYTLSGGILNQSGGISVATNSVSISSVLSGSGGITKAGAGTLTLSGNPNQFTGNTVISNGKVALGAQYALWQSAYDTTGSTGAIGLDRSSQTTPWLGGLAGSVDVATAITGYSGITSLTLNPQTGSSVSYGGVIANGAANMTLNKSGHGTQTLTSANTYSGATIVWAGTLALSGTSGSALNSAFTVKGGTLLLDNSGGTWANRIADATVITNGSLTLKSDNGGSPQTETVGPTTLATSGKITIDNGTGAGTTLAVNGAVTRAANSGVAIDFVGTGGTLGGGAGNPNVTATTLPANTNGILPWATVNGTLWAENNANSVRAYSGTFVDPTSAASDATKNAQLTGSGTMGAAKSFNSLNVIASTSGQSLSLGGILTLTSPGAILKSGADAYSITSSVANAVTAGTELITHVDGGALTISAPLNGSIVGIAKGGTGDLVISGTHANMTGAISIAGGQLEFRGNSTTLSGVITGVGGLTVNLNAGQTLTINNNSNSYAGPTIVKGGYFSGSGYPTAGLPGGITQIPGTNPSQIMSNLKLEGGVLYATYVFNKDLGPGPGQVQILAGTSGFVNTAGSGGAAGFVLDGSREIVWGSTYFNPSVFVHSTVGDLTLNLANGFDLNGSTRTILVGDATYNANAGGGVSQLGGVIRTSSGTAGLTKTGIGTLLLTGASTFNDVVTVSQGTLAFQGNANVASANPLGQSSAAASNLLLANGTTLKYTGGAASSDRSFTLNGTADGDRATLDASGTGALVLNNPATPAYGAASQARTLILTGTAAATLTNTLAANLADNGTGVLSVTKTGTCTWVLSGASTYTGTNMLTAGLLSMSATNNLGAPSTPVVFSGGGLQIAGTAITSLSGIGHPITYTSGNAVTLDIPAANTFTVDQPLGGASFVKTGAGTLVFATNNVFIGQTTISGGVLQYNDGMVIPTTPLLNNGTLAVNRSDTLTQGVNFHSIMGGTGALNFTGPGSLTLNGINLYTGTTKASAGTITLSHPLAIMNSALDTTGATGAIVLSGVTTPTFGGLTGTVAVATALTGYGSVTALTLNPQSGITYNYSGVIANGASGMTLKMVGSGTQILTGNNAYTGTTFLNGGVLSVGDGTTTGKIAGTTDLNFNGGSLTYRTLGANADVDAINNAATITVNASSTFNVTATNAGGASNNETVGAVTLNAGQMSFNWTNGGNSGTLMTLTSLSRSGTASANFNSGFSAASSRWKLTGSGTTTAGEILGPWYTTGGTSAGFASTDYAVYSSDFVAQANITANNTETTWGSAANIHLSATATTLTATRTLNTLRYSAAAGSVALGANNLETYGLLNGGSGLLTITNGTLTTSSGGGTLYITPGNNAITIYSPINNNGGNVTLVKNGANTLTLASTTSTYSGGTVINAGTLSTSADGNFGAGGGITVNGTAQWTMGAGTTVTYNRTLTVNDGAVLTLSSGNAPKTVTGVLSGSGSIIGANTTGYYFDNTGNTFTGSINNGYQMRFASVGDSSNPINLSGSNSEFQWAGGSKVFTLRPFTLNLSTASAQGTYAGRINNIGTGALTIQQNLAISGTAGARTLNLDGTYTGSSNVFSGNISDGAGSVVGISKSGAGTWILSGTNTYTGTTTVSAGKLILSNAWSVASGILAVGSTGKVQLDYTGSRPVAEFWTNGLKAASGIIYNSVNATNYLFGSGSIMVGIETFKVTYNGNGNTGGDVPVDSNAYTNNQTVTVLGAGTLTKGVYSFGGWSKQDGPTYAPGSTFQITTNTTLYAIWRPAGTLIQFK
jgi:autotransporter-associated beta strand protein